MMELRWLTWEDEEYPQIPTHEIQFGRKYDKVRVTKKKLQYRQKVDVTVRAGTWTADAITQTANYQWSEWRDVPTIVGDDLSCP